jgi:hypothetical protein
MVYFPTKKSQFGKLLEGLAMEDSGIFCGHLVYFMVIWYILWPLSTFLPFWYVVPRKIWQPWFGN